MKNTILLVYLIHNTMYKSKSLSIVLTSIQVIKANYNEVTDQMTTINFFDSYIGTRIDPFDLELMF